MLNTYQKLSERIPNIIKKSIIQEGMIDAANPASTIKNTPMEYLFDVYNTYIDKSGMYDSFSCPKCRMHVLSQWKKIKPYLSV